MLRDDDTLFTIAEADAVAALAPLGGARFAYALRNGTVGAYEGRARLWRVKSKHAIGALLGFDVDGDGELELVSGWSNGRVEARRARTGDVVCRDALGAPAAALLGGDLRGLGEHELVAVAASGEVRGYAARADAGGVAGSAAAGDVSRQQAALVELAQRWQELARELAALTAESGGGGGSGGGAVSAAAAAATSGFEGSGAAAAPAALPPASARVDAAVTINKATLVCELTLTASSSGGDGGNSGGSGGGSSGGGQSGSGSSGDLVVSGALIFGEQLFAGAESLLALPRAPGPALSVRLAPARDAAVTLMIKALVSCRVGAPVIGGCGRVVLAAANPL